MSLLQGKDSAYGVLPVGNALVVQADATGAALVSISAYGGSVVNGSVSASQTRTFGPYLVPQHYVISALTDGVFYTDSLSVSISAPVALIALDAGANNAGFVALAAWDDLRFPVQGINPVGPSDAPTLDTTLSSFPGTLLFSGGAVNVIAGVAQMPHSWKKGTAIRPHIHWSKPVGSAAAVAWQFYYRHLGFPPDVAGAWVGPVVAASTEGDPSVTNAHVITSFGDIVMTGKRESSCICWMIQRDGISDADNGDARLYEFDIHYQSDKIGTPSEIPA